MTEWRRMLRSWPKETPLVPDPASLPIALCDPRRLAEARREEILWASVVIGAGSLLPTGIAFVMAAWLAIAGRDLLAMLVMLSGMALGIAGISPASKAADEWRYARRRRRALDFLSTQGEAMLGGEFVGVAYSNRLWHHPGLGHDADEGVLTMDFDRLAFAGRVSRFEIPKAAVLGTEIRIFSAGVTGPQPRLYVSYLHEGRTEALSFAVPYRRSTRWRVREAAELKDRLDAWRLERFPALGARPFVAPPSGDYAIAPPTRPRKAGRVAKMLAVPATIVLLGLIEILITAFSVYMGWRRTGYGLILLAMSSNLTWTVLATKIERRLPERFRLRDPEEASMSPDLGRSRHAAEATDTPRVDS